MVSILALGSSVVSIAAVTAGLQALVRLRSSPVAVLEGWCCSARCVSVEQSVENYHHHNLTIISQKIIEIPS